MKFLSLATLASLASAASVDFSKRESPLYVTLEMVGNTAVKAFITNTGSSALKLFKTGSLLDDTPVEKVEVFQGGSKIPFDGVRLKVDTTRLSENAFRTIEAGETITTSFDIAAMHDVSKGGDFDVATAGAISYADKNSTELAGIIPFSSNTITTNINSEQATKVRHGFHYKRTVVQSDCAGSKSTALATSLKHCRDLAQAAAAAAMSNDAKMIEYFKSNSSSTKKTVADAYSRIVSECGSSTSGVSRLYCSDKYGNFCPGNLAYTLPSESYLVMCPAYFNKEVPLTKTCHGNDQATTTIHEMTHLSHIKGTSDYGVYGYKAVRGLTAAQNLNHADTYCLFANAIYAGC